MKSGMGLEKWEISSLRKKKRKWGCKRKEKDERGWNCFCHDGVGHLVVASGCFCGSGRQMDHECCLDALFSTAYPPFLPFLLFIQLLAPLLFSSICMSPLILFSHFSFPKVYPTVRGNCLIVVIKLVFICVGVKSFAELRVAADTSESFTWHVHHIRVVIHPKIT